MSNITAIVCDTTITVCTRLYQFVTVEIPVLLSTASLWAITQLGASRIIGEDVDWTQDRLQQLCPEEQRQWLVWSNSDSFGRTIEPSNELCPELLTLTELFAQHTQSRHFVFVETFYWRPREILCHCIQCFSKIKWRCPIAWSVGYLYLMHVNKKNTHDCSRMARLLDDRELSPCIWKVNSGN